MSLKKIFLSLLLLCLSTITSADELEGKGVPDNAYLSGDKSDTAVILCHGRGQHPTWDVVDPLRKGIHEQLGYHTVSLQMPTGSVGWKKYADFFPDAYSRISSTVKALQDKGIKKIFLMGHSMGTRMATAYLANTENHGIQGYIGIGMRNGGPDPLNSNENLDSVNIPVIDIYGDGGEGVDANHAAAREGHVSERYKQVLIPYADHRFDGNESDMVKAVVAWLKTQ